MSRTSRRRNTKTQAMSIAKNGRAIKARMARTWKKDGQYQSVYANPLYAKEHDS